jgi:hypothetical protein
VKDLTAVEMRIKMEHACKLIDSAPRAWAKQFDAYVFSRHGDYLDGLRWGIDYGFTSIRDQQNSHRQMRAALRKLRSPQLQRFNHLSHYRKDKFIESAAKSPLMRGIYAAYIAERVFAELTKD